MVSEATLQSTYKDPFVIDAGCACGSILQGFNDTAIYQRVLGVDLSDHMVELGRKRFRYAESELCAGSIASLPVESGSATLLHSAQVLEHIDDELTARSSTNSPVSCGSGGGPSSVSTRCARAKHGRSTWATRPM